MSRVKILSPINKRRCGCRDTILPENAHPMMGIQEPLTIYCQLYRPHRGYHSYRTPGLMAGWVLSWPGKAEGQQKPLRKGESPYLREKGLAS